MCRLIWCPDDVNALTVSALSNRPRVVATEVLGTVAEVSSVVFEVDGLRALHELAGA
jgi:hypothetical protein